MISNNCLNKMKKAILCKQIKQNTKTPVSLFFSPVPLSIHFHSSLSIDNDDHDNNNDDDDDDNNNNKT